MINQVVFVGRVGKPIEIRKTNEGKSVCNFQLGCSRNQDTTDWIPCIAWERTADWISQVPVGSMVTVQGSIQTRQWNGQDGKKNYATEVVVREFNYERKSDTRPQKPTHNEEEDFQSIEDRLAELEAQKLLEEEASEGPILNISSDDLPF